jgi:hypothetical protein
MNIKKIILILLIQTTLLNAQNNTQITNLEKQKTILKENIIKLNDSIKKIDLIISKLNSKEFLSQIKDSSIIATAIKNATLRAVNFIFFKFAVENWLPPRKTQKILEAF